MPLFEKCLLSQTEKLRQDSPKAEEGYGVLLVNMVDLAEHIQWIPFTTWLHEMINYARAIERRHRYYFSQMLTCIVRRVGIMQTNQFNRGQNCKPHGGISAVAAAYPQ